MVDFQNGRSNLFGTIKNADGFGCVHLGVAHFQLLDTDKNTHTFGRKQKRKQQQHLKLVKFFRRPCKKKAKTKPPGSHQYTEQETKQRETDNTTITITQSEENNGGIEQQSIHNNNNRESERRFNIRIANKRKRAREREPKQNERDILESFVKSLHQKSR